MGHSPKLAQRNLPSQHEKDIRGLSDRVWLKGRLECSENFNFRKFDCRQSNSETGGKWPFLTKKREEDLNSARHNKHINN